MQNEHLEKALDKLSYVDLAAFIRFAPIGHKLFTDPQLFNLAMTRFKNFGGWTAQISKTINTNKELGKYPESFFNL